MSGTWVYTSVKVFSQDTVVIETTVTERKISTNRSLWMYTITFNKAVTLTGSTTVKCIRL